LIFNPAIFIKIFQIKPLPKTFLNNLSIVFFILFITLKEEILLIAFVCVLKIPGDEIVGKTILLFEL